MSDNAAEILRSWFQLVWVEGKTDYIAAMLAPDITIQGLEGGTEPVRGREGFRDFYDRLHAVFSDFRFVLDSVIADGPVAAARWTACVCHTGDGAGVPATGKELVISGMTFIEVADGKIVAGWNEWDRLTMLRGIGAIPA